MTPKEPHVARFVEQLGRLGEGEGLPRTAGRMIGLLIVDGGALSIDDIADSLQVSRASVSTNGRLLESLQIVERVTHPGDRHDYFRVSGDPCSSLLSVGVRRMQEMRKAVREMKLASTRQPAAVRQRLTSMERFYDLAIAKAESVLSTWRRGQSKGSRLE
jgi:DNA-binding transcriptional regulator GbsR (MarR family)